MCCFINCSDNQLIDKVTNIFKRVKLILNYYQQDDKFMGNKAFKGKPKCVRGADNFLIQFNHMYKDILFYIAHRF